jgi:predicted AAA+ superfamily ATPase
MHGYLSRRLEEKLEKSLKRSPVVAILGPRQCGKSTLAKSYLTKIKGKQKIIYLDLQNRSDLNKLNELELFFDEYRDHLICFDEIQLYPELFYKLRSEIDKDRHNARFLILGSASRDLIRQSSESLAGRIAYLELTPLLFTEILDTKETLSLKEEHKHWLRGGFPDSFLAENDEDSYEWREDFIKTFLERDIPQLGFQINTNAMKRFWQLLSHYHGQTLNYSKIAEVSELSIPSVKNYLDLLEATYMIRLLQPYEANLKKRLIKSPKLYIRDSGLFHNLIKVDNFASLLAHPCLGASWEAYAIENILNHFKNPEAYFMRSSNGAELDLIVKTRKNKLLAFEFKASKAPKLSRGFYEMMTSIKIDEAYLISPVENSYPYKQNIRVANLNLELADN